MNIVVAPDSFKESMSALEVASAIEKGIKRVAPNCRVIKIPLADGGEGTVEALVDRMEGTVVKHTVTGPLGKKIEASYGVIDEKTAVIEVAAAAGLDLIREEDRNPLVTTTYGVGELILHALDQGVRRFLIGLGGSATNDGGIGMLQALGVRTTDQEGEPVSFGGKGLAEINRISVDAMDGRLKDCVFDVACDVTNPLTGPEGATYVYGPQKGAGREQLAFLDCAMKNYGETIKRDVRFDVMEVAGAGAAGGLGAAFIAFLNGRLKRGIDLVMEKTDFESYVKEADLIFTGEGKIDDQTVYGKTLSGVAKIAKKYDVPVIAITGANRMTERALYEAGMTAIFSITDEPMTLEEAMEKSVFLTEKLVENVMRVVKCI